MPKTAGIHANGSHSPRATNRHPSIGFTSGSGRSWWEVKRSGRPNRHCAGMVFGLLIGGAFSRKPNAIAF
jgi:hypothetical protein